jgi:hypothetical protein
METETHECTPQCPPVHREHLAHLTDGHWHDSCRFCLRRREKGGTGLEGEAVPARLLEAREYLGLTREQVAAALDCPAPVRRIDVTQKQEEGTA